MCGGNKNEETSEKGFIVSIVEEVLPKQRDGRGGEVREGWEERGERERGRREGSREREREGEREGGGKREEGRR